MPESAPRREIPLIFAALFVAVAIWVMAKQSALETEQLIVPVSLSNIPANVKIEYSPRQIPILVKFQRNQLGRVAAQNFEVELDLHKFFDRDPRNWAGAGNPTTHNINIAVSDVKTVNLPQSVRITQVGPPDGVTIKAWLHTHYVPVQVQTEGQPPAQYTVSAIRAEPDQVLITAPFETLERLTAEEFAIKTTPVNLEGKQESFIDYRSLDLPENIRLVNEEDRKATVTVGIEEKRVERLIQDVPIELFVFANGLEAKTSPPTADVRIRGKISMIERVNRDSFAFSARELIPEEAGVTKRVELEVRFGDDVPQDVREGLSIVEFNPSAVDVEILKSETNNDESSMQYLIRSM